MNTITEQQQQAIAARLEGMTLPSGLGTEEAACSIAAINLALTGKLTADIPDCMSEVIGRWIIPIQDAMPDEIRNSVRWKSLLPLAAGTGRGMERERFALITDWMWGTVLPALQPMAEYGGFGKEWLAMTTHRTADAAKAAWTAADAAWSAAHEAAANAEWDAADAEDEMAAADVMAAADAAGVAWDVADVAVRVWGAARVATEWDAARARGYPATAAVAVPAVAEAAAKAAQAVDAEVDLDPDAWTTFDPCDLLERLIRVGEQQ